MSLLFSIIIPTCHRNDMLAKCLDCLAPDKQALAFELYEVIVSDDGTQSTAKEFISLHYPWAKWVKGPMKGPAANRNNGAKHASSGWLIFTDDDCLPAPNWLEVYSNAIHSHPEVKAFEGAIHPTDELEMQQEFAECPVNKTGNNFWSANIAVKNELFWQVGGFDEGYFLAAQEDQQLKIDIEKISSIFFVQDSVVFHPIRYNNWWKAIKGIPKQSKNYGRFAAKNKDYLGYDNLFLFYKEQFYFHLVALVRHFKSFKFKQASISLAWLFFGITSNAFYFMIFKK
ncbi:MAG TPA: family 2 glycosyl transferase [Cytophagales bacterium]|nr:family 2 glycosyl transferase [Cytophagales bacterium]